MQIVIEIDKELYEEVKGYHELTECELAILNGKAIPDNATNGDVVKALFPNGITAKFATFMRFIDGDHYFNCSEEWWNSPYQKGGKE